MVHRTAIWVLIFFISITGTQKMHASHAMGADLTYDYLGNNTYRIVLKFYRDCSGISAPIGAIVNISSVSCGINTTLNLTLQSSQEVSQLCPTAVSTCNGGTYPGVQQYIYTGTITLQQCTDWVFSFSECCRNSSITNSVGPDAYDLYVQATLNNVLAPTNSSPDFTTNPIPYICVGQPFTYNHGVVDANGNTVVYSLQQPVDDPLTPVPYASGFNANYPISTASGSINFNTSNGQMSLTPNAVQIGIVTVLVQEYNSAGQLIGSVMRDMQVIVINCGGNNTPTANNPTSITGGTYDGPTRTFSVCAGNTLNFSFTFNDLDAAQVLSVVSNNISNLPGATFTQSGTNPRTVNFSWNIPPGTAGTYNVSFTATDNNCPIVGLATAGYTINIVGVDITTANAQICPGNTATIPLSASANPTGGTYTWSPAAGLSATNIPNPTATVNGPVTYTVTYQYGGCTVTDQFIVTTVVGAVNVSPANSTVCVGSPVNLTSTFTLNGSSFPSTCAYTLVMNDSYGDGWNGATLNVIVNGSSIGTFSASGYGSTQILNIPNGASVQLNYTSGSFEGENSYTFNGPSGNTLYSAGPTPATGNVFSTTASCSSGLTYAWSPASGLSATNIANPVATPTATTTYIITVTTNQGCSATASATINVTNNVPASITPANPSICPGGSVQLSVTSSLTPPSSTCSYTLNMFDSYGDGWNGGNVQVFVNGILIGTYSATGTGSTATFTAPSGSTVLLNYTSGSWEGENSYTLVSNGVTLYAAGPSPATGNVFTTTASCGPALTYSWSPATGLSASNIANPIASPTATTTYTVTISNGSGCNATATTTVTVGNGTVAVTPPTASICAGTSVPLSVNFTAPAPACGPGGNCAVTNSVQVGTATTTTGTATTIGAEGSPYQGYWHDGRVQYLFLASELTAAGLQAGPIRFIAFNVTSKFSTIPYNGFTIRIACTSLTSLSSYQTGLTTVFNGNYSTVAGWNTHNFSTGYTWNGTSNLIVEVCFDNTGFTSYDQVQFTATGYNSVIYSRADFSTGCTLATSTATTQRPNVRFGNCADVQYAWSPATGLSATNIPNPTATPSTTTTYTVTVTSAGCNYTGTSTINVTAPVATINTPGQLTCTTTSIQLNASGSASGGGITYAWSGPGIVSGGSSTTPIVNQPGIYTITVSNGPTCSASASVNVTQNITPPNVSIVPPAQLTCTTTSVPVTASSTTTGATFNWGGGNTTATNTVSAPNTYSVTATDPNNGCTATTSTTVTQNITPPNVSIAPPAQLTCTTTSTTLTASSTTAGATFNWGGGNTTATNTVSAPNTYSVMATDPGNGCTATTSTTVTQNITPPNVSIAPPAQLTCTTSSTVLTASSTTAGATFNWGGGNTTSTNNVSAPNTYSVTATDPNNGCTATTSTTVTQNITPPNVSIVPPAQLTCTTTSVPVTASSTTTGATFNWGGGITTATNTVSAPNTYSVTATDPNNGCTATTSTTVTQNITPPNVSIAPPAQLTCTTTSVPVTASSTTTGATFNWGGGNTTATNNVSAPNTYSVTATDPNNGCTATTSTTVTQNITPPNVSIAPPAQLTCTTTSTTLTASSTTAGATFNWGGGNTTATNTVSAPNTYSVTATDPNNGCTATTSTTVTQNITPPNVSIASPAQLTCTTTSTTLTASSTTTGATFNWGGGITTATNTVSAPNTYSVTATDPSNGCTATTSTTVTQNITPPNVSIAPPAQLTCTTSSTVLTASSTIAGATFNWGGGITTATNTVSAPNTYSVTATDPGNGCTATTSTTVIQNITPPNVSIAPPAQLTCTTTSTTLTASSTTAGATFNWGGGNTTATNTVSAPNTYSVTATDPANGCTATTSTTVTQNITPPNVSIAPPAQLTCTNTNTTLTANSTTTGATYNWGGGITTATNTVSAPNTYSVTATDPGNGCTATTSTTVTQNITPPNVSIAPPAQLTCTTSSTVLTASSTTAGATFNWGGGNTTATNMVSTPNTYSVTATDPGNGCTATTSTTVTQNITPPNVSIAPPAQLTCTNPSVTLSATTNAASPQFNWSNAATTSSITVSLSGPYSVTVTDNSNGCSAAASEAVSQSNTFINLTITSAGDLTCTVLASTLTTNASVSGLDYIWSTGSNNTTITVSQPAVYSVTASDNSNGCTATAQFQLNQNIQAPSVTILPPATLTCAINSTDLTASATPANATYNWSNSATSAMTSVNTPGLYSVTVTNPVNGCTASNSVTVIQSVTPPNASINTPATLTCAITSTDLQANSGTTGATYNWGNGNSTSTLQVSQPGAYTVTVTDPSNNCTASVSINVNQDNIPPTVVISPSQQLTCTNTSTLLQANAGSAVSYLWSNGAVQSTTTATAPGAYMVTVTDIANGCTASASETVTQSNSFITLSVTSGGELNCSVSSVPLDVTANIQGLDYVWSTGQTVASITVNTSGVYQVSAVNPTDGCSATASVAVSDNYTSPVVTMNNPADLTCTVNAVVVAATVNVANVTYVWSSADTTPAITANMPGVYSVTVTDNSNGCSASAAATVNQVLPYTAIISSIDVTCTGLSNGQVLVDIQGAQQPVTYLWNTNATTQNLLNAAAGSYTVTITDFTGCSSVLTSIVNSPDALTVVESHQNVQCNGQSDGIITTTVTGGTSPYTYVWNDGATTPDRQNIVAGIYSLQVTDANQCSASIQVNISQPALLSAQAVAQHVSCYSYNDGGVNITTQGGVLPYTYLWNDGVGTEDRSNIGAGSYSLQITDANNCQTTLSVVVNHPPIFAMQEQFTNPTCPMNAADGSITVVPVGGVSPYSYLWSNGNASNALNGLMPGNYSVSITDANGCSISSSYSLSYLYDISLSLPSEYTVQLGESVTLDLDVNSNSNNTEVIWSPVNGLNCTSCVNPVATPVSTTQYTVTVQNEVGCSVTATTTVIVIPDYDIYVPNAFTPNGDGNNDVFQIYGTIKNIQYLEMQIFNRWGELVFLSNNHQFTWDGTYKGALQEPQVFVWQLKLVFIDGHTEELRKGSLTLLR